LQRLIVNHKTEYLYKEPVIFGDHRLMFRPRDSHDLRLLNATLTISPAAQTHWIHDVFGNSVAIARFETPASRLYFDSMIIIDRYPSADIRFSIEEYAQTLPFSYSAIELPDLGRTLERHYPDPQRRLTEWTRLHLEPYNGIINTEGFLLSVTSAIRDSFTYVERDEEGTQTPTETLERGSGTCRDFALFMMEAVRSVGLAARFVSGYLYDPAIDGNASDIQGAGSTHAWVQVYLPGAGWVEFDPTNGSYGGHNLVPIAVAREPRQALPVAGTYHGTHSLLEMKVDVSVRSVAPPAQPV
jgi:transglutaminase-like putative cysteine protease